MFEIGDDRVPDSLWSNVRELPSGCWEWTGTLTVRKYGRAYFQGTSSGAHRTIYQLLHEVTLERCEFLDHCCHNASPDCPGGDSCLHRRCVNPNHLAVVGPSESATSSPTTSASLNRSKTHCPRGHLFAGDNLIQTTRGRGCRECRRMRDREWISLHPEVVSERNAAYLAANREAIYARKAAKREANRDEFRAKARVAYWADPERLERRRAAMRAAYYRRQARASAVVVSI